MIYGKPPPSLELLMSRLNAATGVQFPSIGTTNVSLPAALDRVASAEAAVDSAREIARAAARAAGKRTGGLFASSKYILRESGIKWSDEARHEGFDAGFKMCCKHFKMAFRPESEKLKDPLYRAFATRLAPEGRPRLGLTDAPINEVDAIQARILADRQVDLSRNGPGRDNPVDLAASIHKAAARAKSPTSSDPARPMDALAQKIIDSGKKAHRRSDDP